MADFTIMLEATIEDGLLTVCYTAHEDSPYQFLAAIDCGIVKNPEMKDIFISACIEIVRVQIEKQAGFEVEVSDVEQIKRENTH